MDCRSFRKRHVSFVDDTLPGVDLVQMELHLRECAACSRLDQRVRRSLLIARNNAPRIQPSSEFSLRLAGRLAEERNRPATSLAGALRPLGAPLVVGTALSLLALAAVRMNSAPTLTPLMSPLETSVGRVYGSGEATPAFVASFASGMAILPALMLVDEVQGASPQADSTAEPQRVALIDR
ncbi:MAG: anti-sigma factor family protein [Gemmatimonadota bacterium]